MRGYLLSTIDKMLILPLMVFPKLKAEFKAPIVQFLHGSRCKEYASRLITHNFFESQGRTQTFKLDVRLRNDICRLIMIIISFFKVTAVH